MHETLYAPTGKYLWDPWFIVLGPEVHMFHLQSENNGDPDGRHHNNVSIGHAVSTDLKNWKTLPPALLPGEGNEWDAISLWTGSTFLDTNSGNYFLFYTGRKPDAQWVQRLGVATSYDLIHWEKHTGNPILEADNKLYAMSNEKNSLGVVPAFRDPFIYKENDTYYMLFCARDAAKSEAYNGCIGIAQSKDLLAWNLLPPLLSPGMYDEMEVPQLIVHEKKYYLFFMTNPKYVKDADAQHIGPDNYMHCYVADSLLGEYKPVNGNGVVTNDPKLLGLRIIRSNGNSYDALGWYNTNESGVFIGTLSAPCSVTLDKDTVIVKTHSPL